MKPTDIISEYETLMTADRTEQAVDLLTQVIESENYCSPKEKAHLYYLRGKALWRLDKRGAAISDYEHATALDPDSEAAPALTMAREIMDFFNPDMFNP